MFEKATADKLIKKILGNQNDNDGVGDGIPMSMKSIVELFNMMDLRENDVVLEAGYGYYPRIPFIAALITKRPTIAFDPFAHDHFKRTIEGLYQKFNRKHLTWRHPELQQGTSGEAGVNERPAKRPRKQFTYRNEDQNSDSGSDNDNASTNSDHSYTEGDVGEDDDSADGSDNCDDDGED
jgi:hypothetical protein